MTDQTEPYTYTDGQAHRLTLSAVVGVAGTPFVRVEAEDTAIGGAITSAWLKLDQVAALDRHLSAGIACVFTDHTGDTISAIMRDEFTTFTVTRVEDEDDDRASVPVVVLTGRLPEIRRALTATAEEAQQRATPSDAELIEHARTVGMVEPERAPEFVAAYRAHVEKHSTAHGAQQVPTLADVEEQQRQAAAECAHSWTTALDGDDNPARDDAGHTWEHCGICGTRKPAPLTMADRNAHAVGMYATTAVELEDARRDVAMLRARVAELETAAAPTAPETRAAYPDQQASRRHILDSLNTLAHVAIWSHPGDDDMPENTDATAIEVSYGGLGRRATAYALRQVAHRLTTLADAAGETPLDEDSTAAADARNEHLDAGVPFTPAEIAQGQADADHLAAEQPDTVESLLDELADDIPNRRARAIAADYLARYTRLLAADAHAHSSQRGTEMRAEGYRGRAAWCSGMREIARQLDARADAIAEAGR
ncbi:hypothetical protein AB0886_05355 [Streptomyces sp. NPDC024062]|uniref:hypothetical protein n=1 Tax=unclassified Streptomyces TaxID=2593676 RepID=UPI0034432E13